jgi:hypothetical protein
MSVGIHGNGEGVVASELTKPNSPPATNLFQALSQGLFRFQAEDIAAERDQGGYAREIARSEALLPSRARVRARATYIASHFRGHASAGKCVPHFASAFSKTYEDLLINAALVECTGGTCGTGISFMFTTQLK